MPFSLEDPRPGVARQSLYDIEVARQSLFDIEDSHRTSILPPINENRRRRRALLHLILMAERSSDLNPRMTYLAINYADRLFHSNHCPEVEHISLVASACLSIAYEYSASASEYFPINGIWAEDGFIFFPRYRRLTVERQVMDALNQDINSITPFAFLEFFLYHYFHAPVQELSDLFVRACQFLIRLQRDNEEILQYKPSEIAAAALFCSVRQMFPLELPEFANAVEDSGFMNQDDLEDCYQKMCRALGM